MPAIYSSDGSVMTVVMIRSVTLLFIMSVKRRVSIASERVRCATARYIVLFIVYRIINPSSIKGMLMKLMSAHPPYSSITIWCVLPVPCSVRRMSIDSGITNAVMIIPTTRMIFGVTGFIGIVYSIV